MPPEALAASVEIDGHRMRELRQLAGHNLSSFGQLVKIDQSYVGRIERGGRRVSPAVFVRICDALGVKDRRDLVKAA